MSLYIAGPMTGIPQFNIPAFDAMAEQLRSEGYDVVSPAELDDPAIRSISLASVDGAIATLQSHGQTWGDFLARDVKLIADDGIDGIVVLPGWEKSRGARLETFVAFLSDLPILYYVSAAAREPGCSGLDLVPELELFRAWTGDRTLRARQVAFA